MDCIIHSCEDTRNETVTTFTDISWRHMSLSAIEWLSLDESNKRCVLTATHIGRYQSRILQNYILIP